MAEKVLVTNEGALRAKYGTAGWKSIHAELKKLIRADAKKGLNTQLVRLDKTADMTALGAPVVSSVGSARQNKLAIDGVWRALAPDYLLILGAPDVVPHQSLTNPVGGPGGDDDATVPSDLPYACDAPFAHEIETFLGPTRAIGRLSDVSGGDDRAYLLRLLRFARTWKSMSPKTYKTGFALSAAAWKGSTGQSARALFGSSNTVQLCPPKGPVWSRTLLGRRAHFINCHGARVDPKYYGEGDGEFPDAHRSTALVGLRQGTVAAAECCYGAELYDPDSVGTDLAMANAYMHKGAYGFFGSTTIAYGPATGNGAADLICQYFLRRVQKGASLGRATLEARQDFVEKNQPLDPVDLKTLGQFLLLGDPSIHPVRTQGVQSAAVPSHARRSSRRRKLGRKGRALIRETASVVTKPDRRGQKPRVAAIAKVAAKASLDLQSVRVFDIRAPKVSAAKTAVRVDGEKVRRVRAESLGTFHVLFEGKGSERFRAKAKGVGRRRIKTRRIIIVRRVGTRITERRELYPR